MRNGSDQKAADAVRQIVEEVNDLSVRFVERCNFSQFKWQAGQVLHEYRDFRSPGMVEPFQGHVTLFHLLGHGFTKDDAIAMAKENPNRRRL